MVYYYFYENRIVGTTYEIRLDRNPKYEALNEEQLAFYKEHPTASASEVRKCKLNPPYHPYEPTLEELKVTTKNEISKMSLECLTRFVDSYQLANAQVSLVFIAKGKPSIYDEEKANYYINTYERVGKICRTEYYECVDQIDAAQSKEEVNAIKVAAEEFYRILLASKEVEE